MKSKMPRKSKKKHTLRANFEPGAKGSRWWSPARVVRGNEKKIVSQRREGFTFCSFNELGMKKHYKKQRKSALNEPV
jgi:hypothetical protein